MKHLSISMGLAIVFSALVVNIGLAQTINPPDNDSFVRVTTGNRDTNFNTLDLSLAGATSTCTPTDVTYLQWDMSGVPNGQTIASAELTLNPRFVSQTSAAVIGLYETGDNWTEGTITANNAPAEGTLIESKPAPTIVGQDVLFNSSQLSTYLNNQAAGDDSASFIIRFISGCPGFGASNAIFEDEESVSGQPNLDMWNPTVIELTSVRAVSPSNNSGSKFALFTVSSIGLLVLIIGVTRRSHRSD